MELDQDILIALGSNQALEKAGSAEILSHALRELEGRGVRVLRVSRFFTTPCFPAGVGPDYLNAAAMVQTALSPRALLEVLHEVEAGLGRERIARWGARTVDLDLIAYGQRVLPDVAGVRAWLDLPLERQMTEAPAELILPHPRMQDRGFVLVPLADVAPDWVHPVLGRSVRQMLEALPEDATKDVRSL